jgi:organic radical activating enzyme
MKLARMPDGSPEIFHTLQGEGRNTGKPSVFIRSSLCNLHCKWCDTPYTWNWEDTPFEHESERKYSRETEILDLTAKDIAREVSRFTCSHYVLTGGEPLLQEKGWLELITLLPGSFEVETNGTLFPSETFLANVNQINVSPKLAHAGMPEEKRINRDALSAFAELEMADWKFVIENQSEYEEMKQLIDDIGIAADRVFLMPKASTVEELNERQNWVADLAREQGFRYSDRLHLRLHGAKRGT